MLSNWPPPQVTINPESMILGGISKYVMRMDFMLMSVALYVGIIHYMQPPPDKSSVSRVEAKRQNLEKKAGVKKSQNSPAFTAFVFLHNLFLAVYSGWTFTSSFPILISTIANEGLINGFCDKNFTSWNSGLFELAYIFYLSKYYEIVDTVIILMKGRRSSTLQTYHHSGAIISMFAGVYSCPAAIFYFVIVNSFIHTIMYSYYALTSLGFSPPGKQYLTSMQITQFIFGIAYASTSIILPGCSNADQNLATTVNLIYALPLLYLFVSFAVKMYGGDFMRLFSASPKKSKKN
ncbi:Elongation of fatty acids protein sre1 [Smittium mucronatum]|uniref:Elongation of fatty acids protein n=1 Tax=Smittium mucronatum TaxID=133383 RepID=A0A1R0H6L6_9FUNG|nr:Elongation of fatty acids protein sre1 [Smittium mucronatum]